MRNRYKTPPLWITQFFRGFSAFIIAVVLSSSLIRAEEKTTTAAIDETETESSSVTGTQQEEIEFPTETPPFPSPSLPAEADYRIGIGDRLRVVAFKELDITVLVRPDGKISLPVLGEVGAAGRLPMELGISLSQLANALVVVMVEKIGVRQEKTAPKPPAKISVAIIGEVKRPGVYEANGLFELIAKAGGFAQGAARNRIQLMRHGVEYRLDFDDYELENEDFVMVVKSFVKKTQDFISWVAKPARALLWFDGIL